MSMMYSVVPNDIIFKAENKNIKLEEVSYKGAIILGVRQKDNSFLIDRVISSDPKFYLDKALNPGNCIKL